jgi:hypothetical protein
MAASIAAETRRRAARMVPKLKNLHANKRGFPTLAAQPACAGRSANVKII